MTKKKTAREETIDKLLAFIVTFWGGTLTQLEGKILHETLVEGKKFGELDSVPLLTSHLQKQIFEKGVLRLISRIRETSEKIAENKTLKKDLESAQLKLNELEVELVKFQPKPSTIPAHLKNMLETRIVDTDLSARVKTVCRYGNVTTLLELVQYSRNDFLKLRNCGKACVSETEDFLKARGLSWEMPVSGVSS